MPLELAHKFRDEGLLRRALTHTSAARKPLESNERLEFLGDRILNMLVAELLHDTFPQEREGDVAKRLTSLVCAPALAHIAEQIGLPDAVQLSSSERQSGGAHKMNVIADALEALVAALYLDGGLETARAFVRGLWTPLLQQADAPPQDAKSALQEWAQARGLKLPVYELAGREGPDHEPVFTVTVTVEGQEPGTGAGASKRDAEKAAAENLLGTLS